jgi:hypothetical protein
MMDFKNNTNWIWLHATDLNPEHPIFKQAGEYDAILFIWDEAHFASQFYSKKRLFFIWQCLQDFKDLPLIVIKGETDLVLKRLYKDNPNTVIFSPENPNKDFSRWDFVESLSQEQLVEYDKNMPFFLF